MEQPQQPLASDDSTSHDHDAQAELTHVPQSDISPPHSTQTTSPPFDGNIIDSTPPLSFPTLSPDGSIEELPTVIHNSFRPAPPAALSPLGRTRKMAHTNYLSDSASSLDEIQYDMIDDASDFSNDDRETASLASTERGEGQMTPEDSIVDIDEEREDLEASATLRESFDTEPGKPPRPSEEQTRAENELLDSYMTDNLETPRQSLLRESTMEQTPTRSSNSTELIPQQQPATTKHRTIRLLFVSETSTRTDEVTRVCQYIATCLATKYGQQGSPKAVKLPPTPSGSTKSSMVIIAGDVELIIDHCVYSRWHIDPKQASRPLVFFRQEKGEFATLLTYGSNGTLEPDIALYYFSSNNKYPQEFEPIQNTLPRKFVVSIAVGASGNNLSDASAVRNNLRNMDIVVSTEDLFDDRDVEMGEDINASLAEKQKARDEGRRAQKDRKVRFQPETDKQHKSQLGFIAIIILVLMTAVFAPSYLWAPNYVDQVALRRGALFNALSTTNISLSAPGSIIDFMVPYHRNSTYEIRCAGGPDGLVVGIPMKSNGRTFSKATAWNLHRSKDRSIDHNVTQLIDGVYGITISPQDAYGEIHANFLLKDPAINGTCTFKLGNRMLQKRLYEKVTTGISRVLNEDAAVAAQSVKTFTEKLGLDLAAGAAASKNVTNQLAVYAARELSLYVHTGASILEKLGKEAPGMMQRLNDRVRRDAQYGADQAQRGFKLVSKSVEKGLQTTSHFTKDLIPTKKSVGDSLYNARERALGFKNRLQGLKKDTNSTSATKELSLRLQNLFKPTEQGQRAGSLKDIATCARTKDYLACRREQRQKAKEAPKQKTPNAVAKVEEKAIAETLDVDLTDGPKKVVIPRSSPIKRFRVKTHAQKGHVTAIWSDPKADPKEV